MIKVIKVIGAAGLIRLRGHGLPDTDFDTDSTDWAAGLPT
jgi:hypothetical protein